MKIGFTLPTNVADFLSFGFVMCREMFAVSVLGFGFLVARKKFVEDEKRKFVDTDRLSLYRPLSWKDIGLSLFISYKYFVFDWFGFRMIIA